MGNLIDIRSRTTAEQRQIARQGGIASGAARKQKRLFRETLLDLLAQPVPDEVRTVTGCADGTFTAAICAAIIRSALMGNVRAFETIRDTIGEKPSLEIEAAETAPKIIFTFEDENGNNMLDELGG